jgi:hypothetical protein
VDREARGRAACGAPVATDEQDPDPQLAFASQERGAQAVRETRVMERSLTPWTRML